MDKTEDINDGLDNIVDTIHNMVQQSERKTKIVEMDDKPKESPNINVLNKENLIAKPKK